jgi:hypothetical protein
LILGDLEQNGHIDPLRVVPDQHLAALGQDVPAALRLPCSNAFAVVNSTWGTMRAGLENTLTA